MKRSRFLDHDLPYIVLVVIAVIFVVPLLWVVLASVDAYPQQSIKVPQEWTLENYIAVLTSAKNQLAFKRPYHLAVAGNNCGRTCWIGGLSAFPL